MWGAALMWLVDTIFGYVEQQAEMPTPVEMLNDLFLACRWLGLIIWLVVLLIKDPKGVIRAAWLKQR